MADTCADYDHNVTRACARRASSSSARRRCPEYGILPDQRGARCSVPRATRGTSQRTPGGSSGGAAAAVAAGHGAGRARQRRRRLDPDPRRLLRAGRPEARARAHLGGAGARRLARSGSTACSRAPSPTPPRSSTCSPATSPATRPGRRRRRSRSPRLRAARSPRPPADRGHVTLRRSPTPRSTRSARARRRGRRGAAALARARGRGGRPAVAGRGPARAVRRGLLDRRSRSRSPTPGRVAGHEPTERGHGADELGDLLDGHAASSAVEASARPSSCRPSRAG